MVRIDELAPVERRTPTRHSVVEAGFQVFEVNNETYLKIVTFGAPDRQVKGVVSQTIQFGPEGIAALRKILAALP
jgi:hypothetical protein